MLLGSSDPIDYSRLLNKQHSQRHLETLMQPIEPDENPYASPKCVESQPDADALLKATVRLYRGMGWAGIAYLLVFCPLTIVSELARQQELGETIGGAIAMTTICGLMAAFFVLVMKTADRLGVNLDRSYRRARWLGIITGAMFFPLLTIPAILAVRRLERYRKHMMDRVHDML